MLTTAGGRSPKARCLELGPIQMQRGVLTRRISRIMKSLDLASLIGAKKKATGARLLLPE